MSTPRRTCPFVLVLVTLVLVGPILPEQAAWGWTKNYRCYDTTGVGQTSLRVITNGLESVVYTGAYPTTWQPAAIGYTLASGVFCTTLTYAGPTRTYVRIGWTTADASCRLRDLRWGNGQAIVPKEAGGIPGGGMVFYGWPDPGDLTVVITNDTDGVITLSDIEFAISGYELSLEELDSLLDTGFVQFRVDSINDDIAVLRAEVVEQGSLGILPSPSANSLDRKLERAAAYKDAGLTEYLAGDLEKALFLWGKAAGHVGNFISEVTAASQKGNLSLDFYERWIIGVAGGPATAPEIRAALLALPEGQSLQSLETLACGELPAYPGLNPANCVEWPQDELYPGEFTAFVVHSMDLGAGFIMGGSVLDENGNVLLDWLEQSVAEPTPIDAEPPEITGASATPEYLWPPDHSIVEMTLDVTVTDNSGYALWYVAEVASNQPDLGTGDGDTSPDWGTDPDDLQSVWLRSERSGNDPSGVREYTITLMAIDAAGNLSDPSVLVVRVDHDNG